MKKHKLYFTDPTAPATDAKPDTDDTDDGPQRYFYSPFGATITALLMLIGELTLALAGAAAVALLLTALC